MSSPVLVVQHQDSCPPALLGAWLTEEGAALRVCRPDAGEPLPGDLSTYRGLLVLGGTMGANDDAYVPWLGPTKQLLRTAAREGVPALGVCLGHQLAAVALGGMVRPDARTRIRGVAAVGWQRAAAGDPLVGPLAATGTIAVQWNRDSVVTLPAGAVELARRADGQLQAARFAPTVWGVQWHPEADADVVATWAAHDRAASTPGSPANADGGDVEQAPPRPPTERDEADLDAAVGNVAARADQLRRTWRPLARQFAALCLGSQPGR